MKREAQWALLFTVLLVARGWIQEQLGTVQAGLQDVSGLGIAALQAIEVFLGGPAVFAAVLFSRITPKDVIEHKTRARIRSLVAERPGIGLSEVADALSLGWGTTVYHVNRMEAAGLVSSAPSGRRRALFLPEHGRVTRDALTLLANDTQVRLLSYVDGRPGCSQRELAAAADVSLPLANRYLQRLEGDGLVVSQKSWRTRAYQPTTALREFLAVHALRRKAEPALLGEAFPVSSAVASVGGTNVSSNIEEREATI